MRHKQNPTKQRRHKSVTFIVGSQTSFSQQQNQQNQQNQHQVQNNNHQRSQQVHHLTQQQQQQQQQTHHQTRQQQQHQQQQQQQPRVVESKANILAAYESEHQQAASQSAVSSLASSLVAAIVAANSSSSPSGSNSATNLNDVMRLAFLENNDISSNNEDNYMDQPNDCVEPLVAELDESDDFDDFEDFEDLSSISPERMLERNIQLQIKLQRERRYLIQLLQQNGNNQSTTTTSSSATSNNINPSNINNNNNSNNNNNNNNSIINSSIKQQNTTPPIKSISNTITNASTATNTINNNNPPNRTSITTNSNTRPRRYNNTPKNSNNNNNNNNDTPNNHTNTPSITIKGNNTVATPSVSIKSHNISDASVSSNTTSSNIFHCDEPDCGKSFPSLRKLRHHKVVHSDEFPFVCAFQGCNKKFKRKFGIDLHSTTHFDLDPDMYAKTSNNSSLPFFGRRMQYSMCKPCGQKFKTVHEYQNHMLKHGKEPFKCPVKGCGQSFTIWKSFQKHRASHYFNYYCKMDPRCKHHTSNLQLLKLHIYCCHFQRTLPDNATLTVMEEEDDNSIDES